jgi:hypothetical protein
MQRKVRFKSSSRPVIASIGLFIIGLWDLLRSVWGIQLVLGVQKASSGPSVPYLFIICVCLAVVFYLVYRALTNGERVLFQQGEEVKGAIVSDLEKFGPSKVAIEYFYKEKQFQGEKKFHRFSSDADYCKAGNPVRVFLDPNNPKNFSVYEFSDFAFPE